MSDICLDLNQTKQRRNRQQPNTKKRWTKRVDAVEETHCGFAPATLLSICLSRCVVVGRAADLHIARTTVIARKRLGPHVCYSPSFLVSCFICCWPQTWVNKSLFGQTQSWRPVAYDANIIGWHSPVAYALQVPEIDEKENRAAGSNGPNVHLAGSFLVKIQIAPFSSRIHKSGFLTIASAFVPEIVLAVAWQFKFRLGTQILRIQFINRLICVVLVSS